MGRPGFPLVFEVGVEIGNKTIAQLAEELGQIPFFGEVRPEELLSRVAFFSDLPAELMSKAAAQILILQFPPGKDICRQGDYEETFYIIITGAVDVITQTHDEKVVHLATLGKDEFFGEMGPLSGQPRTATVRAHDKTVVLQVPKGLFLELLRKSPAVKKRIDEKYVERSLRTHLKQVSIFSILPEEVLEVLAGKVELVSFKKGEVIVREGELGDFFYLVRSGFVKVSRGPLEHDKILTYLREGNYFGEMAMLREEKRNANVAAITDVETVRIKKKDFQDILCLYPEVKRRLEETMTSREENAKELAQDDRLARAMSFVVKKGLVQAREILVVDLTKCISCDNCVKACTAVRSHSRLERRGSRLGHFLVPTSCFHCENPECLLCAVGGIVRDKDGEIHFTEFCVGCGRCAKRCPWGNILVVPLDKEKEKKRGLRKGEGGKKSSPRQMVVKCDMCTDFKHMACVYNCPTGAMHVLTPEDLIAAYDKKD